MRMAGEIKPWSCLWVKTHIGRVDPGEWIETDTDSGKGFYRKDWAEYLIRDHPALPAVAALLHEPGLAAAVRRSMAALQAMADGLAGNGPGEDVEYAAELIATQDVMGRLAAALEGETP